MGWCPLFFAYGPHKCGLFSIGPVFGHDHAHRSLVNRLLIQRCNFFSFIQFAGSNQLQAFLVQSFDVHLDARIVDRTFLGLAQLLYRRWLVWHMIYVAFNAMCGYISVQFFLCQ